MINGFDFHARTKVFFGIGRSRKIAEDVKAFGEDQAVLVTDPGLVKAGLADEIVTALKSGGIEVHLFHAVQSDPTSTSVDAAADLIRETGARCVLGLGGGSAMDVAKLASMVAGDVLPAEHYALMAHPFQPKKVKSIMIPTTSGTGAEVTSTVVFSTTEKRKVWGWDDELAPDLAILDPTLTVALPPHLTAATGLDAIVHAIEAVTGKRRNPMIHALSLQAIRMLSKNLVKAVQKPDDMEARVNLSIGAMLAGMAIEQGGTGIAHCIGHALGTLGRIHHGRAVALALYAVYNWNIPGCISVHADIARALGVKDRGQNEEELAYEGADRFIRLVEESGIYLGLQSDGLTLNDVDRLVDVMQSQENQPMRWNNCRESTVEDLRSFAEAILSR